MARLSGQFKKNNVLMSKRGRGRGSGGALLGPSEQPPPVPASASSTAPLLHGAHIVGYTFLNNRLFYADALAGLALHDVVRVRPVFDEGELGDVFVITAEVNVTTFEDVLVATARRYGLPAALLKAYTGRSAPNEQGPRDPINAARQKSTSSLVPNEFIIPPAGLDIRDEAVLVQIPTEKGTWLFRSASNSQEQTKSPRSLPVSRLRWSRRPNR